jgi:hypothetical protein
MDDDRMHPAPRPPGSNPLDSMDPAFMVPSVGGEVMMNGEIFLVTHVQLSNERIADKDGNGRHTLRVQFCGQWDEPGYTETRMEDLI